MPSLVEFVASLDAEIGRLEQAVESIPEVRQLAELRRVRALYPQPRVMPAAIHEGAKAPDSFSVAVKSPGRKMAPERQRALGIVTDILSKEILPIKTAHLWAVVERQGIALGGNDPVNSLSALLSTSGQFQAHGRSGWTLKNGPKIEPDLEAHQSEDGNGHNPMNG